MASTFEKVTGSISDRLHGAGERIADFKDDTARDVGRRVDKLGAMMKKHPMLAIGIVVSLGVVVGYVGARVIHRG